MRWLTLALLVWIGCAVAALGLLVAADVRVAIRPDPTAWMIEHGRSR